jgi:hypothetical protein
VTCRITSAITDATISPDVTALVSGGAVSRVEAPRILAEHRSVPLQGRRGICGPSRVEQIVPGGGAVAGI